LTGSRLFLLLLGLVALLALLILSRFHPLVHLFLGIWVPLPILLVGWRLGAGAAVFLALAGVAALWGLYPLQVIFLELLGPGYPLAFGLLLVLGTSRGWPLSAALMITVLVLGFISLGLFLGQALVSQGSLAELWSGKSQEVAALAARMLKETGISLPDPQVLGIPLGSFQELIRQIFPALTLINLALTAWLNTLVARWLVITFGGEVPGEPFSRWACPEWLIFVFLVAGFGLLIPWAWVRQASLNFLLLGGLLYFFQGLAVLAHLLQHFKVPRGLRGVGYILAFLNPIIFLVMVIGLLDLWLDFRGLQSSRQA